MKTPRPITPCLWFDDQAEEAAQFYVSIFPNSRIIETSHYGEAGQEIHGKPPGSVMTVSFELNGQPFTALNAGPQFKFNESISFQIECETQEEVDHYWNALTPGGDPSSQQCGWLKDRYALSWQVFPQALPKMLADKDPTKSARVMTSMLHMKKIDLAELEKAYAGA
jgi:predicted 3-demethylubiquinone-9 3-methyltransferase (glyoxalase superfamily)